MIHSCLEGSEVSIQAEIGGICYQFRILQVLNIITSVTHSMNVQCSLVKVMRTVIYQISPSVKPQNTDLPVDHYDALNETLKCCLRLAPMLNC